MNVSAMVNDSTYAKGHAAPSGRILVIDDEQALGTYLRRALGAAGYQVDVEQSGSSGLAHIAESMPDLVILDVILPDVDGHDVVRSIRALPGGRTLPVVMLTARGSTQDRIDGLDAGADDYMVKPFPVDELMARIRTQLRRRQYESEDILEAPGIRLDLRTRELSVGNERFLLTTKEFDLLALFMRHQRRVLTRGFIAEQVWGDTFDSDSNVIDVWVHRLRQKLERTRGSARIYTVRGSGYVMR